MPSRPPQVTPSRTTAPATGRPPGTLAGAGFTAAGLVAVGLVAGGLAAGCRSAPDAPAPAAGAPAAVVLTDPGQAGVVVDAGTVLRPRPVGIGGSNIGSHARDDFQTGPGVDYQGAARRAAVPLLRTNAYPDDRGDSSLAFFDRKVLAVLRAGARPLFVAYINPGLKYYDIAGRLGTGGTPATNMAFLVKHYQAPPFNLAQQTWEVGNEPDIGIDYRVPTARAYCDAFRGVHAVLAHAGVRSAVTLAGPATAGQYRWPSATTYGTAILDDFVARCGGVADLVTYHSYAGGTTPAALLNTPHKLDNLEDALRTVSASACQECAGADYGVAALEARMAAAGVPARVGVGLTEHNANNDQHGVAAGLWNLAVTHFHLYDPRAGVTTSFVFDAKGADQGGFGHFDAAGAPDYAYWALYVANTLRGRDVVAARGTGHPNGKGDGAHQSLLVTGTRDPGAVFVEVVNRTEAPVADTVAVLGAEVAGPAAVYELRDGVVPDHATPAPLGARFAYTFPAYSATVIRIPVR